MLETKWGMNGILNVGLDYEEYMCYDIWKQILTDAVKLR